MHGATMKIFYLSVYVCSSRCAGFEIKMYVDFHAVNLIVIKIQHKVRRCNADRSVGIFWLRNSGKIRRHLE